MGPSVVLADLLSRHARGRALKMAALTLVFFAGLVGVGAFALDMYGREAASPMGHGVGPWICGVIGGLPTLLGVVYGLVSAVEQVGGGPDLRFLRARWADVTGATTRRISFRTTGGEVGSRTEVVVTLKGGETTTLTLPSHSAEQTRAQIVAELALRPRG